MRLGAAGIRSTANGYTKICTNEKQGAKIPLVKVLESLENFFQEVFKRGLGQSPKVLGFGTESQGLMVWGKAQGFPPQNFPTACGKACGKKRKAVENSCTAAVFALF